MAEYIKTHPLLDAKQVYEGHMNWVRGVINAPTPQQKRTMTWLLNTKIPTQKQYVIINDRRVKSPTNTVYYRKTTGKWRRSSR